MLKINYKQLKKYKRSGSYRRTVVSNYSQAILGSFISHSEQSTCENNVTKSGSVGNILLGEKFNTKVTTNVDDSNTRGEIPETTREIVDECDFGSEISENTEETVESLENVVRDLEFRSEILKWALAFNISHVALRELFLNINKIIPYILPKDPRTLLMTNRMDLNISPVDTGNYWHNGVIRPLKDLL